MLAVIDRNKESDGAGRSNLFQDALEREPAVGPIQSTYRAEPVSIPDSTTLRGPRH